MGEDPKAERGTDARTLPTVTQKRRCFGLPGFVYDCNIWYRRFWKSFMNFKEKKRSPASDFKMLWTGDYPLESMGITWHKTIPSARRTRASLYWALLRFLSQPTGKSAIPQATSAIIMNISNIQLSSHHYSIAQEPPSPLIPPQVTPRGCHPTWDHGFSVLPQPWDTALQFANWWRWAGLQQKSSLSPFWQKESIIPRLKAPKDLF